jgi:hypothetical protein
VVLTTAQLLLRRSSCSTPRSSVRCLCPEGVGSENDNWSRWLVHVARDGLDSAPSQHTEGCIMLQVLTRRFITSATGTTLSLNH